MTNTTMTKMIVTIITTLIHGNWSTFDVCFKLTNETYKKIAREGGQESRWNTKLLYWGYFLQLKYFYWNLSCGVNCIKILVILYQLSNIVLKWSGISMKFILMFERTWTVLQYISIIKSFLIYLFFNYTLFGQIIYALGVYKNKCYTSVLRALYNKSLLFNKI